jgi:hypothetical protein
MVHDEHGKAVVSGARGKWHGLGGLKRVSVTFKKLARFERVWELNYIKEKGTCRVRARKESIS